MNPTATFAKFLVMASDRRHVVTFQKSRDHGHWHTSVGIYVQGAKPYDALQLGVRERATEVVAEAAVSDYLRIKRRDA